MGAPAIKLPERILPLGFDRLPVLEMHTAEFHEDSVRRLAAACSEGPLCQVQPLGTLGVTRFADVDAVLRDWRTFSARVRLVPPLPGLPLYTSLLNDDPPDHTRLRTLVGQTFTAARVAAMETRIRAIARALANSIVDGGAEFDLVEDLAIPLPTAVITELLGVETARKADFKRWSDDLTGLLPAHLDPDPTTRSARLAVITESSREIDAYLTSAIAERQKKPTQDILSFLANASEGGDHLSSEETLSLAKLLLIAGNETTTKLISLAMNLFLKNPPALADLGASPGLLPGAIEEVLRYEGPVADRSRVALEDCVIAGLQVPAGTTVTALIGAANHDASVFPEPTVFDIRRSIKRHLAFGGGIHLCIGAPLARLETRIAFEELLSHVEAMEFVRPPERARAAFRGFSSMPLRFRVRPTRAAAALVEEPALAEKIGAKSDAELGLDKRAREVVRVAAIRDLSPNIKLFRLVHPSGGLLTRFTAGSHILVHLHDGEKVYRNAYSLLNAEYGNGLCYFFAVAKEEHGRGGSRYLHEQVKVGMEIEVSVPANNFPAGGHAEKHLLIAGGIGITPIFALRSELRLRGEPCELHYAYRAARRSAFVEELEIECDPNVHLYSESLGHRLDMGSLLLCQPKGTHLYVCGPEGMMTEAIERALGLGWPKEAIHFERFGAPRPAGDQPFEVVCRHAGITLTVPGGATLLEVLEQAGLPVPFACRAGSCGACETTVIEGEVEHRDTILTDAERAERRSMMVCVSRGKTRLVLDV